MEHAVNKYKTHTHTHTFPSNGHYVLRNVGSNMETTNVASQEHFWSANINPDGATRKCSCRSGRKSFDNCHSHSTRDFFLLLQHST